ncbi:hypothetical protein V1525DRAFT_400581 [Lipomyces kononenkoae]|uniref:Uncharacterized protein n=1 Tax=Lipomyces kononenkoae TaxID=34357 RepID=A0ACC3T6Z2_LIPKO
MTRRGQLYGFYKAECCIILSFAILYGSSAVLAEQAEAANDLSTQNTLSAAAATLSLSSVPQYEPEATIDNHQTKVEEALAILNSEQPDLLKHANRGAPAPVNGVAGFLWKAFLQLIHFIEAKSLEDSEAYLEHRSGSSAVESELEAETTTAATVTTTKSSSDGSSSTTRFDDTYAFSGSRKPVGPLGDAVALLEEAAENGNADAMYLLADMNFYGNYSFPRNYTSAMRYYRLLADTTGNATAQNMLGFMYATGMFGYEDVPRDQARALMYHTFAAYGGNTRSEMTLAFRYHAGISTPRNCEKAVFFYKRVADKAMEYWRNGPSGGRTLDRHTWKLADDNGGVYGEGASESSSGANSRKRYSPALDSASLADVLEYLLYMAEKFDIVAQYKLARLYYDGTRMLPRNYDKAMHFFKLAAKQYWKNGATPVPDATESVKRYAGYAAGYLGRMYLRGEGTKANHAKALQWYKLGVEVNDPPSLNGYGYMHLKGLGGLKQNTAKAAEYFRSAADLDFGPAQVNIGKLFLEKGEVSVAIHYFELAARHGHIEAFYYLAETHYQPLGRERSCGMATVYYKIVAEKVEDLQSPLAWAHRSYDEGDFESALVGFMMAAEQGYESGQANVAYLLDRDKSAINLSEPLKRLTDRFHRRSEEEIEEEKRLEKLDRFIDEVALIYWTRASKQSNVDALVKMGDYYLKGIGCERDNEKAAACYQAAAEYQQSALALWNLGWMHENGLGVEQDFHLAKRFYDLALTTNSEAYLPVTLALYKLRLRSFWNSITGGSVNGIHVEETDGATVDNKKWSFSEFLRRWLEDLNNDDYDNYGIAGDGDNNERVNDDTPDEGSANYAAI